MGKWSNFLNKQYKVELFENKNNKFQIKRKKIFISFKKIDLY
jgi:hypothetical protein